VISFNRKGWRVSFVKVEGLLCIKARWRGIHAWQSSDPKLLAQIRLNHARIGIRSGPPIKQSTVLISPPEGLCTTRSRSLNTDRRPRYRTQGGTLKGQPHPPMWNPTAHGSSSTPCLSNRLAKETPPPTKLPLLEHKLGASSAPTAKWNTTTYVKETGKHTRVLAWVSEPAQSWEIRPWGGSRIQTVPLWSPLCWSPLESSCPIDVVLGIPTRRRFNQALYLSAHASGITWRPVVLDFPQGDQLAPRICCVGHQVL
jgi:hypothetical protein